MSHPYDSFEEILRPQRRLAPDRGWSALREQPVRREPDGRWVISGYPEMRQLLSDPRVSSVGDGEASARLLISDTDAPDHEWMRRYLMRQFGPPWHPGKVAGLEPQIRATTKRQLDLLADRTEMDVVDDFAYHVPVAAICALLGIPDDDHDMFAEWMQPFTSARNLEETVAGLQESKSRATPYLHDLLRSRRADPRDDMVSGLAAGEGDDRRVPDDDRIVENLFLLFLGGHETTINAVSSAVLLLMHHPSVLEEVSREPALLPALFEEVLRLEPPAQMFANRRTLADVEIAGNVIPRGSTLVLVTAAANRDPRQFPDPDVLDVHRAGNAHLSFQSGAHYCFGAPLARLEGRVMIGEWVRRVVNPELVDSSPVFRDNAAIRGPLHLNIAYDGIRD
ncbi:cytochrome P450 [Lentzea sp. NPDC060358]|uniref:cytochrome P450 n=1 Tax=Lentzea sp. NPDC060358 TaxID=3347103 RepID=UPI00364DD155